MAQIHFSIPKIRIGCPLPRCREAVASSSHLPQRSRSLDAGLLHIDQQRFEQSSPTRDSVIPFDDAWQWYVYKVSLGISAQTLPSITDPTTPLQRRAHIRRRARCWSNADAVPPRPRPRLVIPEHRRSHSLSIVPEVVRSPSLPHRVDTMHAPHCNAPPTAMPESPTDPHRLCLDTILHDFPIPPETSDGTWSPLSQADVDENIEDVLKLFSGTILSPTMSFGDCSRDSIQTTCIFNVAQGWF
ncbi:hypothetical protein CYLTODRAFT_285611 [Cylindrobasidium torrendii FP15055 ss-10]|uniref:Uncharacterized protein n=1 Tax=Cylindrobasidium torrendii FP15055 ss-10 TaxID=1314674 RepID=A0A0D7BRB3_9AGAR|nr:hypothetical protein CYLTODRAFT_285611 [Cylindrobasidium torrendii FP15055 ss-10]